MGSTFYSPCCPLGVPRIKIPIPWDPFCAGDLGSRGCAGRILGSPAQPRAEHTELIFIFSLNAIFCFKATLEPLLHQRNLLHRRGIKHALKSPKSPFPVGGNWSQPCPAAPKLPWPLLASPWLIPAGFGAGFRDPGRSGPQNFPLSSPGLSLAGFGAGFGAGSCPQPQ